MLRRMRRSSDSDLSSEEDLMFLESRKAKPRKEEGVKHHREQQLLFTSSASHASEQSTKNRKRPRPGTQKSSHAQGEDSAGNSNDHQLWVDKHAPQSTSDLVLHATKVQAIRDWLLRSVASAATGSFGRPCVLAICGKSGSGKSTAVSLIAKEMGIQVTDWSEDLWSSNRQLFLGQDQPQYQTFAAEFREFVVRSAYPTLAMGVGAQKGSTQGKNSSRRQAAQEQGQAGRIVIMHDAPQLKDVQLTELLAELRCPLVVVVSDVTDKGDAMFAVERLLNDAGRSAALDLETLFVPAVTELKTAKVLGGICRKERLSVAQSQLTALATAAMGDLRHAIMSMQALHSHTQVRGATRSAHANAAGTPGRRDLAYSAMHSVGKLLHAKLDETGRMEFDADAVLDACELNTDLTMDFLHHNLVDFMADEDQLLTSLTSLGDAEILHAKTFDSSSTRDHSDEVFPQAYVTAITARSIAAAVGSAQRSHKMGFKPMHRPKLGSLRSSRRHMEQNMQALRQQRLQSGTWLGQSELAVHEVPYLRLFAQHEGILAPGLAASVNQLSRPQLDRPRSRELPPDDQQLANSAAVLELDDIDEDFGDDESG